MPPQPNGLQRDLNLVRRRAWLFIPFFLLGILLAYAFGSVAGDANAVASLTLDTVIQDVNPGGDRGFRIYEAESMTADPRFREMVERAIGEEGFDYSRFSVSLSPIAVADGVSRGVLTVSITDEDKATAERYRQAFVDVFAREFQEPDGLFRTRFLEKKQEVVDDAEENYEELIERARPIAEEAGIPLEELVRPRFSDNMSLLDALAEQEGQLIADIARAEGLGNAAEAQGLRNALAALRAERASISDPGLDPELRRIVTDLRGANDSRESAYIRLNDARASIASAQSEIEVSYTFSGGLAGSLLGRIAVVIAVTLVFGLIAIYAWEWLSQVRAGAAGPTTEDGSAPAR